MKLCGLEVVGDPVVGISRLPLGSPRTKNHLDVAPMESYRLYYKGEGGGFPPSLSRGVSCESGLLVGHPNTKRAPTMH
jgi:hypothetical protein